jgi:rubredoxin
MRYICCNCGYIYDPETGDPENGIEPGMPFAALPDNWVCPICYVTKDNFDPLD